MNVPVSPRDMTIPDVSSEEGKGVLDSQEWRLTGRLLARRQLPLGWSDLPLRESNAARAAHAGACQTARSRALGNDAWSEFHLRPSEPDDQTARSRHDLHRRSRSRRTGAGRQHLSRGQLQRDLSRHQPRRSRDATAVQTVLVSWRHFEPCRPDDARLDSRGRRTWIFAEPRLRRRVRQSGVDRRLHRRRRRSRNRPLGDRLAIQQIPRSDHGRRGSADLAPERLQDQQPDSPRPRRARGTGTVLPRLRLGPALRRGRRAGSDASSDGGDRRSSHRKDPFDSKERARKQRPHPTALADDRPQIAQGLDRARRWSTA